MAEQNLLQNPTHHGAETGMYLKAKDKSCVLCLIVGVRAQVQGNLADLLKNTAHMSHCQSVWSQLGPASWQAAYGVGDCRGPMALRYPC